MGHTPTARVLTEPAFPQGQQTTGAHHLRSHQMTEPSTKCLNDSTIHQRIEPINLFTSPFTHLFIDSQPLPPSLTHSLIHCLFTHSLTHSLSFHSPIHSPTSPFTHSLTTKLLPPNPDLQLYLGIEDLGNLLPMELAWVGMGNTQISDNMLCKWETWVYSSVLHVPLSLTGC